MACSSGNSTGSGSITLSTNTSTQIHNSGSEEDFHLLMNERKRKRKLSNLESARRSRMRKQKHMDDLRTQVTQLRKDNNQILSSINMTTQHSMNIEAENSVLKAQMMELNQRLESLNDILSLINNTNGVGVFESDHQMGSQFNTIVDHHQMNLLYMNQPIMASAACDIFQY